MYTFVHRYTVQVPGIQLVQALLDCSQCHHGSYITFFNLFKIPGTCTVLYYRLDIDVLVACTTRPLHIHPLKEIAPKRIRASNVSHGNRKTTTLVEGCQSEWGWQVAVTNDMTRVAASFVCIHKCVINEGLGGQSRRKIRSLLL